MSRGTSADAVTDDQPAGDRAIDHESIPDSFVTTIRVERSTAETYRATQHDTDIEGYGSSPHLAIVDFVRRAERRCFGDAVSREKGDRTPADRSSRARVNPE